ncbi:23032_t:CDS:1, partial [Racocetra persica]
GHIVKDCLKHDKENDQINKGVTFNNVNIYLVEFTETKSDESSEYLKVELVGNDSCGDIRVFSKRKRGKDNNEPATSINKRGKILKVVYENEKLKCYNYMMYIPFSKLTSETDILKKIS